jgi:mycothiol synthase
VDIIHCIPLPKLIQLKLEDTVAKMTDSPYIIRNYQPTDFDGYVLLCREAENLRPSEHPVSPQIVADWLNWPDYFAEKDLFIVEINGDIIGCLDLRPEPGIGRVILNCYLRLGHRGKGLARELLARAIRRARELGVEIFHVNVSENAEVARAVLSRLGFNCIKRFHELELDMTRLDGPEAERAIQQCRYLNRGEEDVLTHIQNRSFAGTWGYNPNTPEMIAYYIRLGGFSPEKVILACEEEDVIGYCWTELVGKEEGVIHMLGTDPAYRGRGIGRRVLLAGLAYLRSKGVQVARLTVDSENTEACNLYKSVGFEVRKSSLWYAKTVT